MDFTLYNTLSRKKEKWAPLNPPHVLMYVCGPTVYDYLHIGNFRGAVFYNFLRLWLEKQGYKVRYYYNLTDVDDKIIKKAHQEKTSPEKIAQKYSQTFFEDFHQLKLKPHEGNPKATEFIKEMIELIQELIKKKQAYEASGHVFYRVHQFKNYGKLSRRRTKDMQADFEKEALDLKENKEDFSLWKKSKENEPSWPSPWGPGRPGWHIECTAMVHRCLQTSIDIHGGGMDLIFPHHENEIAQSEGCKKPPFAKYWVHHNMFERGGEKISKSLGKIPAMHDFLSEYNAEIFKYLVFSAHYRSTIEFSEKTILQSMAALSRIYQALLLAGNKPPQNQKPNTPFLSQIEETKKNIDRALNDDLNTAKALGFLFSLVRVFNELTKKKGASPHLFLELFKEYGSVFSLFQEDPKKFLDELDEMLLKKSSLDRETINESLSQRQKARQKKDFKKADEIRDSLRQKGVMIQDLEESVSWRMDPHFFMKDKA